MQVTWAAKMPMRPARTACHGSRGFGGLSKPVRNFNDLEEWLCQRLVVEALESGLL